MRIDYTNYDDDLMDATLILQKAFKKIKPDSAGQWQARATLLSAIHKLTCQFKNKNIQVKTDNQ